MYQALYDRRRAPLGRRYQPKELNAKHHEILRLALLGYSNVQIASMLGCTTATVSTVRNSGLGRQHSALLSSAADCDALMTAKRLRDMSTNALDVITMLLNDDSVSAAVRLGAAKDVLDRAGFAAPKQLQVSQTTVSLTKDDLEGLKAIAYERALQNGLVIDTSGEVVEESENA